MRGQAGKSKEQLEIERAHILLLLKQGWDWWDIMTMVGWSKGGILNLKKKFQNEGKL